MTLNSDYLATRELNENSLLLSSGSMNIGFAYSNSEGALIVDLLDGASQDAVALVLKSIRFETTSTNLTNRSVEALASMPDGTSARVALDVAVTPCTKFGTMELAAQKNFTREISLNELLFGNFANGSRFYISVGQSSRGANITETPEGINYTPPLDFTGTDTVDYTISDGNRIVGKVRLCIHVLATGNLVAIDIGKMNPGIEDRIQLQATGVPGQLVKILASGDLLTWKYLGSARVSRDGVIEFIDAAAKLNGYRFYRAIPE